MKERFEARGTEARAQELQPRRPGYKRFTTDAAIKWGRRKGWKLMDRESYDFRLRRHHDLPFGADAMFETPNGIVYVQGAGKSEAAAHRARFESHGGAERADRLSVRFAYLEFIRGVDDPIKEEWWA